MQKKGEDGGAPIEPIIIESENELKRRMNSLRTTLDVMEHDMWQNRRDALREMQGIMMNEELDVSLLVAELKKMRKTIEAQIVDKRSIIVREVNSLLVLLSKRIGPQFELFAEAFIPLLMKNTIVKIQIISEPSDNTIREILKNTTCPRILKTFFVAGTGNNPILRRLCAEYVEQALNTWDNEILSDMKGSFAGYTITTLSDATVAVKENSRRIYWRLRELWPEVGESIYGKCDYGVRKILDREFIKRADATSAKNVEVGDLISAPRSARKQRVPGRSDTTSTTPHRMFRKTNPLESQKLTGEKSQKRVRDPRMVSTIGNPRREHGQPRSHQRIDSNFTRKENVSERRPLAVRRTLMNVSQQKSQQSEEKSEIQKSTAEKKLEKMIEKLRSKNWQDRFIAFISLRNMIPASSHAGGDVRKAIAKNFAPIFEILLKSMNDPHPKVSNEFYKALQMLFDYHSGDWTEEQLLLILPTIVLKLSDPAEVTSQHALNTLNIMSLSFPPEKLFPVLLATLRQANNARLLLGCIELVLHVLLSSVDYLLSEKNFESLFSSLSPSLSSRYSEVRKAASSVFVSICEDTDLQRRFEDTLETIHEEEKAKIIRAIEEHVNGP